MCEREFHVFADGYNILHAWGPYQVYMEENLEVARNALIEQMAEYRSLSKNKITLVFDAHKVKGQSQRTEYYKGVEIVYTKPLETADLYIERQLRDKIANYRVVVVSNDSMIQQIILGRGGIRTTVQEFMTGLEDSKNQLRRMAKRKKTARTRFMVSMEDLLAELEDENKK